MGYRLVIYVNKDNKGQAIAEGNNGLPVLWSLIYGQNPYTVVAGESPVLTISEPIKPLKHSDELLQIFLNDVTHYINERIHEGYTLNVDLADILDDDLEHQSLEEASENFITTEYGSMQGLLDRPMSEDVFFGFSYESNLNPTSYEYFKRQFVPKKVHKNSKMWRITKAMLGILSSIIFFIFAVLQVVFGTDSWFLVIGSFVLSLSFFLYLSELKSILKEPKY